MKSEGIVRTVDSVGRLVLPHDIRERIGINTGNSAVEIFTDGDCIILKKYAPTCLFCENADNLIVYKNVRICRTCLDELESLNNG